MGFKRTTEGRVFFQGSEDSANDEPAQRQAQAADPRPLQHSPQQTQFQILSLLKSLNERLQATQTERNKMRNELESYRTIIEELESKSAQSERVLLEIEQKFSRKEKNTETRAAEAEKIARDTLKELEETRRLLLQIEGKADRADKNVSTLVAVQKTQAEKIAERLKETEARQEDLGSKVEETISQQARLVRKVDKAVEDRARFMRKIERIEETVIQTRDALNARAMVLLTDQNPSAQSTLDDSGIMTAGPGDPIILQPKDRLQGADLPFWKRSWQIQTSSVIPFVVVVLLAGWMISEARRPEAPVVFTAPETNIARAPAPGNPVPPRQEEASVPRDWSVQTDTDAFSAPEESQLEPETTDLTEPTQNTERDMNATDDIGTTPLDDDAKLLALLESDPDALAAQLNAIEPGQEPAVIESAPAETKIASVDTATKAPVPEKPRTVSTITAPVKPAKSLSSMKPDAGLPDMVREIERQAFEGVPEAQHDLAAIYTAGHGGVKQDYARAAFWFRHAADQGIANARYNLGVLYHQGLGIKPDTEEAIRWYKSAADLGHPEAQYNLGIAYIEGIGVAYDPVQASQYFENAANSGVMEAAYNLGLIYENGLLGQAKPDVALMWYKTAADQGSPEAKAALEQLAKTLSIKLEDVNSLVENMRGNKKSEQKNTPAVAVTAPEKQSQAAPQEAKPPVLRDTTMAQASIITSQGETQAMVAQIQEYLMRVGLYPGPADGVIGPLTEDAIRSYQAVNDFPVDGQPSSDLLTHMLAN